MTSKEELNSIIMELRKNNASLQKKFMKEESDKLAVVDSLTKEKEARLAAERLQWSLSEDLGKSQRELASANQKVSSLNDMDKRLQEYNTSLQQYNSKLQTELVRANETLKHVEKEKASIMQKEKEARLATERLQVSLSDDLGKNQRELASANQKVSFLNDMYRRLQEYNTSLQQYNSKLQTELARR